MEKRAIVALLLSLLILIGYQLIITKIYPPQKQVVSGLSKQTLSEKSNSINVSTPTQSEESQISKANQIGITQSEDLGPISDEEEILYKNDIYEVVFSNYGGVIKKVLLNQNIKQGLNIPYELFNVKNYTDGLFLTQFNKNNVKNAKYSHQMIENGIEFICKTGNNFIIKKKYLFHESQYFIELEVTVSNVKNVDAIVNYSMISGIGASTIPSDDRFLEIIANTDSKLAKYKKHAKPFEIQKTGVCTWQMLKTRYFCMILKPFVPCFGYFVDQNSNYVLKTGVNIQDFTIPANSSATQRFGLYVGPSDPNLVKNTNLGLETALTSGFFASISQLLISTLKFFHSIFRNWGIAIITLTIFINLLLSPLTIKSYKSMQEMQILQPKIEKIRQELKNNPQKLQKEIMELYKKYKVNPMGGCLPMVLQMPIFIALYNGLMNSIELRGSKFLWIKDLSVPEGVNLPFTLPLIGNTFNFLPILMLVAMFFQQKLTNKFAAMAQTDEQRQQQKMMSVMMTVMFGFLFYNFPSGLVLYWLSNTIIMTVFQFMFTRMPKPTHLLD